MKLPNLAVFYLLLLHLLCVEIGATSARVHLYSKDRNLILKLHNDFRRSVGATNMMELVWDFEAAKAAADSSENCIYNALPDNGWSRTMNQFLDTATDALSPVKIFRDSFKKWSKEGRLYDVSKKDFKDCNTNHMCSSMQLLTAEVRGVGCALTKCPVQNMTSANVQYAQLFVCFYTPRVNITPGQALYLEGMPCSACPVGTKCINKLCAESKDKGETLHILQESPQIRINVDSGRILETKGQQVGVILPDGNKETYENIQDSVPYYANVVIPFPGPEERRDVRLLARMERRQKIQHSQQPHISYQRKKTGEKKLNSKLTDNNLTDKANSTVRRKRQTEEYVRRRNERYQEQLRRHRELQALRDREDGLNDQEQYFTIAAHNMFRKQERLKELTWSSRLERWAKYVIRCDTEYPGPITCYTNFGKSRKEKDIYTKVYDWASEGPFRYNIRLETGCRTPADKTACNHNTVLRTPDISEMACASMDCGTSRQLTCIYH